MNRAGLYEVLDAYLAALGRRDAQAVRWADGPLTSENNVMLAVGDGLWGTIEAIGTYRLRFADQATGQVGYFGTVLEPFEESAYTVRLRVNEVGRIQEAYGITREESERQVRDWERNQAGYGTDDDRASEPMKRRKA